MHPASIRAINKRVLERIGGEGTAASMKINILLLTLTRSCVGNREETATGDKGFGWHCHESSASWWVGKGVPAPLCSPPEELARAPESSSSLSSVSLPAPPTARGKAGLAQHPMKLRTVPRGCLVPRAGAQPAPVHADELR